VSGDSRRALARALLGSWPQQVSGWGQEGIAAYLSELEARGVEPDALLARIWYRRAIALGSEEPKKTPASASRPPRRQGAHIFRWDTTPRRPFSVM